MRPVELTMSAFGPYVGNTVISFETLGREGVYLITGETGAGKTTIFDAVTFALYGRASGSSRNGTMLRSKYARADQPTFVRLVFECRGECYTIERNPRYRCAKVRGEGMKEKAASAVLTGNDMVCTGVDNVNKKVWEIIGLDCDQFTQVSMIAQGEFLKLLYASTSERVEIFRHIFKTGRYKSLEDAIREDFLRTASECADLDKSIRQYAEGIVCTDSKTWDEIRAKKEYPSEIVMPFLQALIEEAEERQKELKEKRDVCTEEKNRLSERIRKAEEQKRKEKEWKEKKEEYEELEKEAQKTKEEYGLEQEKKPDILEITEKIAKFRQDLPAYEEKERLEKENKESRERSSLLEKEIAALEEKEHILLQEKEEAVKERDRLSKTVEEQISVEDALRRLLEEKERIRQQKEICSEYEEMCRLYEEAKAHFQRQERCEQQARHTYEKMRREYMRGQAGIMAAGLEEGMPCPVCGSTIHPAKAVNSGTVWKKEEVEQAEEQASVLTSALQEAFEVTVSRKAACTGLEEKKCWSSEEIKDREREVETKLAEAEKKKDEIQKKKNRCRELEDRLLENGTEREKIYGTRQDKIILLAGLQAKEKETGRRLAVFGDTLPFENRDALEAEIKRWENERENREEKKKALWQKQKEQSEKLSALQAVIGRLEEETDSSECIAIEEELKQWENIQSEEKEINQLWDEWNVRLCTNREIQNKLKKQYRDKKRKEKEYTMRKRLHDTANGGLHLETYVQMAYFDRILFQANKRLDTMTGGQYELIRQEEETDARKRWGLELDVLDHYNGTVRSVKTLSGGEAFKASLALALGLSDEIQEAAGGIRLDTMFIDEGFGALDEESLLQAVRVLFDLGNSGRLVGIISHVAELKSRIERQIVVKKNGAVGSRADVVTESFR